MVQLAAAWPRSGGGAYRQRRELALHHLQDCAHQTMGGVHAEGEPSMAGGVKVASTGGKAQKRAWKVRERGGTWRASASGGFLQSI